MGVCRGFWRDPDGICRGSIGDRGVYRGVYGGIGVIYGEILGLYMGGDGGGVWGGADVGSVGWWFLF